MNLNDVGMFVATGRTLGIREAAAALKVPASTVSRAINRLEKQAGLLLCERSRKGVRLTDAGREYFEACRQALEKLQSAERALEQHRTQPRGTLTIGMPTTFAREMVLPFLKGFVKAYPELTLKFVLHECDYPQPPEDVDFDIFFQAGTPKESSWRVRTFPAIRMCLAASPDYLTAAGVPRTPEELVQHRFVSWGPGGKVLPLTLRAKRQFVTLSIPLAISITHASMQNQMVQQGLGIGYLQLWEAQPALAKGALELILPEWQPEPVLFCALYRQRAKMLPKIEAFMTSVGRYITTEHDPRNRKSQNSRYFARNDDIPG